ncbi:MAG: hypothetical protein HUJ54_01105 [Erysipelotrichaceae bacterium]|nr:hypothetical protein [Erysipelotrichaceae bacterium]
MFAQAPQGTKEGDFYCSLFEFILMSSSVYMLFEGSGESFPQSANKKPFFPYMKEVSKDLQNKRKKVKFLASYAGSAAAQGNDLCWNLT